MSSYGLQLRELRSTEKGRVFIVGFRDVVDFRRFEFSEILKIPKGQFSGTSSKASLLKNTLFETISGSITRRGKRCTRRRGMGSVSDGLEEGIVGDTACRYGKDGADLLIKQRGKNPRMLTRSSVLA